MFGDPANLSDAYNQALHSVLGGITIKALELDELPLPFRFAVRAFEGIRNAPLRAHIERVGILCIAGMRLGLRHHEGSVWPPDLRAFAVVALGLERLVWRVL